MANLRPLANVGTRPCTGTKMNMIARSPLVLRALSPSHRTSNGSTREPTKLVLDR